LITLIAEIIHAIATTKDKYLSDHLSEGHLKYKTGKVKEMNQGPV
jgi:hypothetical protein